MKLLDVIVHGVPTDVQSQRNLLLAVPLHQLLQDLPLLRGQR